MWFKKDNRRGDVLGASHMDHDRSGFLVVLDPDISRTNTYVTEDVNSMIQSKDPGAYDGL
jgi:hypothetical protein